MKATARTPREYSDAELIDALKRLASRERQSTTELLRFLIEFDARRLYLAEGYPSLFAYCTQVLHYSEHAALNRIEVARAASRWPVLLDQIADGRLTLAGARLIAPHLTRENIDDVLARACHKTKREIEELVVVLRPKPDVRSLLRKAPTAARSALLSDARPAVGATSAQQPLAKSCEAAVERGTDQRQTDQGERRTDTPGEKEAELAGPAPRVTQWDVSRAPRPVVVPLAPDRYKVQFTIGGGTRDKLREAQDLMRHTVPDGVLAVIFDRALAVLLLDLQRKRFAATDHPRPAGRAAPGDPQSRRIPAAIKREVWRRDGGRCAFVTAGKRCDERAFLEFHHVVPFAAGGSASVRNIELRCRAHNAYEARLFFGGEDERRSE